MMSENTRNPMFLYIYAKWILRGSTVLLAYIILTGLLLFACWPNGENCVVLWLPFLPFDPLFFALFWVSLVLALITWPIVAYLEGKMGKNDA